MIYSGLCLFYYFQNHCIRMLNKKVKITSSFYFVLFLRLSGNIFKIQNFCNHNSNQSKLESGRFRKINLAGVYRNGRTDTGIEKMVKKLQKSGMGLRACSYMVAMGIERRDVIQGIFKGRLARLCATGNRWKERTF